MGAQKKPVIEKERRNFKQLILTNPNYFGTLPSSKTAAIKKIVSNSSYEELTCIGYNPNLHYLEATIHIKRPYGYGGNLCAKGTTEYVRFFIDYGAGWEDVGLSAFTAHDIPTEKDCAGNATTPLVHVLTHELDPRQKTCNHPVLPKVRGILSWEAIPSPDPNTPPVWGNVLDRHIQIKPKPKQGGDLVADISALNDAKIVFPKELQTIQLQPLGFDDLPELTFEEKAGLYHDCSGKKAKPKTKLEVEPFRFGFEEVQGVLNAAGVDPEVIAAKAQQWEALGFDWQFGLNQLQELNGNVSYEQLECLGLDYNRDLLAATFRIKRPYGYLGGPCSKGSKQYVQFWADWEDQCKWTPLDLVSINVHDYVGIPADGLSYSAVIRVDLDKYRRACTRPRIGRIRAVLSWNNPPSDTDPDEVPYWGNILDAHVLIKPGKAVTGPLLSIVGGVGLQEIETGLSDSGLTKPNAVFALQGSPVDGHHRKCPFGGRVVFQGPPWLNHKYRVRVQEESTAKEIKLNHPIYTVNQFGFGVWRNPEGNGLFSYLPVSLNINNVLAYWDSAESGLWRFQLQAFDGLGNYLSETPWRRIRIDNKEPDAKISLTAGPCEQFKQKAKITGKFVARDLFFGHFSLTVKPTSTGPNAPFTTTPATSQTAVAGDDWSLDTASPKNMMPCGYVVEVNVWDRTIVNSGPNGHNHNRADVGFCLLKA